MITNCVDDNVRNHFNHAVKMSNGKYPNSLKLMKAMILDFELKSKFCEKKKRSKKEKRILLIPTVVPITITTPQPIIIIIIIIIMKTKMVMVTTTTVTLVPSVPIFY